LVSCGIASPHRSISIVSFDQFENGNQLLLRQMGGKDIGVVLVPRLVQIVLVRPRCKSIGCEGICPELCFSTGRPSATEGRMFVPQTN
jgi:hypothetical protein